LTPKNAKQTERTYPGLVREVERPKNKIFRKISNAGKRKKMKEESSDKVRPKTKKVRLNLYGPGTERVFLAGDFNACVLVIQDVFGMHKNISFCQGRPPEYHL